MPRTRLPWWRAVLLGALAALLSSMAAARAETGRFLLISDIHFDPFYDGTLFGRLAAEPSDSWAAILETSQPPGFNPRGTDSNYALLRSSLDDARRRIPNPDFILYPGDLMAHEWQARYDALAPASHLADPEAYREFTTKALQFLAGQIKVRYPATSVLLTLGNDDSYCGDYMIEPDGPFLAMLAEVWEPLLHAPREQEAFRETFARGGYYSLRLPGPAKHRLVVLNSVVCSVNYDDACGSSTQTPALDQFRWLEGVLECARADGELVWLLMHIPPGINGYNSAESVPKGQAPVTFWQPELTSRFLQILERHAATIQGAFVGHTHMDDFRVIRLDGKPTLLLKIAPAISPIFGNNPGYQVYQYDRTTGAIQTFQTYYLTDLPSAVGRAADPVGRWALEYDFQGAYDLPGLTPETVARLADRLADDTSMQQTYTNFYGVSAPPEFPPQLFPVYRCAIANVTPAEFLRAYSGRPKPARPRPHPDRLRPAEAVALP